MISRRCSHENVQFELFSMSVHVAKPSSLCYKPSSLCFPVPPDAARQSAARVKWQQDACRSLGIRDRKKLEGRRHKYDHILIDDANRMLFCDAPKTGSSFLKILWLNYTRMVYKPESIHDRSFLAKHQLRYLSSYNQTEIQTRLETYFKFMVVRHPFVRILSAYIEKLEKPNEFYQPILGRIIERKYAHIPARQATGKGVTFSQMIQYIVDNGPFDHHWTPVSLLCNPCEITYDYIARLETSHVDYKHIFSKLKNVPGSKTGLPRSVTTYRGATDLDMIRKYYKTVPINITNSLFQTYNTDFQLFGYTWNTTSQSYGDRMNADGKEY